MTIGQGCFKADGTIVELSIFLGLRLELSEAGVTAKSMVPAIVRYSLITSYRFEDTDIRDDR